MFKKHVSLLTLLLLVPIAACDDSTDVGDPGTLSLLLTDAPGDFTQAIVTIKRIELVGDGQPLVLEDVPFTTDLLMLSNDVASLLEDETIPGGTYSELRFIIPEACIGIEQSDGSEAIYASSGFADCGAADGNLQLPSFAQTGIKVNLPGGALEVDGDAQMLLVDFDVSQSFGQQAGASGLWVMTPVIMADDVSLTGSVVVELTVPDSVDLAAIGASLADFQVRLETEALPQPFTDEDGDGTYTATFLFLMPDASYEVAVPELQDGVTAFQFTTNPDTPQDAAVGSGAQATVGFEVTSTN